MSAVCAPSRHEVPRVRWVWSYARARVALNITWLFALFVGATAVARADWQPGGVQATRAVLADVLAAYDRGMLPAAIRAQRREHWTYTNGSRRIDVAVALRNGDFRTSLELDGLTYMAGRIGGVRWRASGNGIVHGVEADLQGDALDRAPQAIVGFDPLTTTLVGETQEPVPAWVLQTHPAGDKPAFLYVARATATIVREVVRDGKRVITTNFDNFEALGDGLRARHWRVTDGIGADTLDVTVNAIEPAVVDPADVFFPSRRVFVAPAPLAASVDLEAVFARGGEIRLRVSIAGKPRWFVLDTGTASITVDPPIAERNGGSTLGHAVLPTLDVGPLHLDRVSVLAVPFNGDGILGHDFFFGHVIEIDYRRQRVRVLSDLDVQTVFADPKTTVIDMNVDQGLPLARAAFGAAQSDTFALDTGSPRLYVMRPFMRRYMHEIDEHWTTAGRPFAENYLEGGIELQPYRVAQFAFAGAVAHDLMVGGQIPARTGDDLAVPFDGIIGTDILANFDLYFDYDRGRLGLKQ